MFLSDLVLNPNEDVIMVGSNIQADTECDSLTVPLAFLPTYVFLTLDLVLKYGDPHDAELPDHFSLI